MCLLEFLTHPAVARHPWVTLVEQSPEDERRFNRSLMSERWRGSGQAPAHFWDAFGGIDVQQFSRDARVGLVLRALAAAREEAKGLRAGAAASGTEQPGATPAAGVPGSLEEVQALGKPERQSLSERVADAMRCLFAAFLRPAPKLQAVVLPLLPRLDAVRLGRGAVVGVHLRSGHADWDFADEIGRAGPPGRPDGAWTVADGWRALDEAFRLCPSDTLVAPNDADIAALRHAGVCYNATPGGFFERAVLSGSATCADPVLRHAGVALSLPDVPDEPPAGGGAPADPGAGAGADDDDGIVPKYGTVSGLLRCGSTAARAFALAKGNSSEPWEREAAPPLREAPAGDRPWAVVFASDLAAAPLLASLSPLPKGGAVVTSRNIGVLLHATNAAALGCAAGVGDAGGSGNSTALLRSQMSACEAPGALRTFTDIFLLSICDGFVRVAPPFRRRYGARATEKKILERANGRAPSRILRDRRSGDTVLYLQVHRQLPQRAAAERRL